MEDTKSLLMMVLHKIFHNQPKTVENMFQLIHSFNNGKDKKNYEKTLKTICDLMNDELPSPILVYLLTLVDMPQDFDSQSPVLEKMRRTHDYLPEINVRPHLLEYLNNMKPSKQVNKNRKRITDVIDNSHNSEAANNGEKEVTNKNHQFTSVKPVKELRRSRKLLKKGTVESSESLLDICAMYIVKHETALKVMYKQKQTRAWQLINGETFFGNKLQQCYNVVTDLNKKMKWLRAIESDNITVELLTEEYKNCHDIFLQDEKLKRDPFKLSQECEKAIDAFVEDD